MRENEIDELTKGQRVIKVWKTFGLTVNFDGNHSTSPYAGMTRIRFYGSLRKAAKISARFHRTPR